MTLWKPIETAPEGELVLTKIHDRDGERNIQKLMRCRYLWWLEDRSMYVYYTPTHWAPALSLHEGGKP